MESKNYTQATKEQETPKESKQQDGLYKIIPFFTMLNSKILCVEIVCNFVTVGLWAKGQYTRARLFKAALS